MGTLEEIQQMQQSGMSEAEIIDWIKTLDDVEEADPIQKYRIQCNVEKFAKELAWFCLKNEKYEEISKWVLTQYI